MRSHLVYFWSVVFLRRTLYAECAEMNNSPVHYQACAHKIRPGEPHVNAFTGGRKGLRFRLCDCQKQLLHRFARLGSSFFRLQVDGVERITSHELREELLKSPRRIE